MSWEANGQQHSHGGYPFSWDLSSSVASTSVRVQNPWDMDPLPQARLCKKPLLPFLHPHFPSFGDLK